MVAYLSSEPASATTGGAIRVDGGYGDSILPCAAPTSAAGPGPVDHSR